MSGGVARGGAMGAVRPWRHFWRGAKIDVIPKNKNREDVKKRSAKKWGVGQKNFFGVKEFLGGQKIFRGGAKNF